MKNISTKAPYLLLIFCSVDLFAVQSRFEEVSTSIFILMGKMLIVMFAVYLFTKSKSFIKVLNSKAVFLNFLWFVIFFSLIGIYATIVGKKEYGAIANFRDLGPIMAGFVGGPIVGFLTGLMAAIHRFSIGGFTKIPCSLATILAGIFAGLLAKKIKQTLNYYLALLVPFTLELFHMILILLLAKPFETAWRVVQEIVFPMVFVNCVGVLIFIFILRINNDKYEIKFSKKI
ncbi:MAG: hypothetical protein HQ534_04370 [Armatimonadetes bacterium]|nr:hypothetical protein [Armatimonadota bacterium]